MTGKTGRWRMLVGAPVVVAAAAIALAAGGGLDSTLGTGGVVIVPPDANGNRTAGFNRAAVQSDGRIVTVGGLYIKTTDPTHGVPKWGVRRFLESGALDTSFGTGGTVALFGDVGNTGTLYPGNSDVASDVAIDGNGMIYVTGIVTRVVSVKKGNTTYDWDVGAVRLNPDGSLDTTWGTGGKSVGRLTSVVMGVGSGPRLALQSDGKLLLAHSHSGKCAIARLTSSGAADTSYGTGGVVVYAASTFQNLIVRAALDPSGRLVTQISSGPDNSGKNTQFLVRFTGTGAVDSSFPRLNLTADLAAKFPGHTLGVQLHAVQSDGSPLLAGASGYYSGDLDSGDAAVVRYTPSGSLDTTFGTNGLALVANGVTTRLQTVPQIAIRPDGKIVGAWNTWNAAKNASDATVFRILASGAVDGTFGTGGVGDPASFDSTITSTTASAIALAPDGRIVLAGIGHRPPSSYATSGGMLVRYFGD